MKRRKITLQMFADEPINTPSTSTEPAPTQTESTEPQKDGAVIGEKKYSDDDVNKIVNERFSRWQKEQEKAIQEAKEEAAKLAKMNQDQKQQYELKKLQKENEELKRAAVRVELAKTASGLLQESGIEATEGVLNLVVGDDANQTKANIEAFVKVVEAQVKKAEIARATGITPSGYKNDGKAMSEIDKRLAKYS